MIVALIPAAGKSRRMGVPKLSLLLGKRTVLEKVIEALRLGGVDETIVVVGPHVRELATIAESSKARALILPQETTDMRETVALGLDWIESNLHPTAADDWLLVPADHPVLDARIIQSLVAARQAYPQYSIVVPVHNHQRGHPLLMSWQHVAELRSFPRERGINEYMRTQTNDTYELIVDNPGALVDMDTWDDYVRLRDAIRQ